MSHQDIAAVWSTLEGRSDIDSIVHEFIGRYSLNSSQYSADRGLLRAKAFEQVVALRTIFDLQRTYLQAKDLSFESSCSLLQPNILLSCILHLLELKASAFQVSDILPDHEAYCDFIGQTQLSGLRALLLHDYHVSPPQQQALSLKLKQAWEFETLSDVNSFTVRLLGDTLLVELSNPTRRSRYSKAACGVVDFPDFYRPIAIGEGGNAAVLAARNAAAGMRTSGRWFESALILYEISWSTTAATIQLCMERQTKKQSGQWSFSEETVQLNHLCAIDMKRFNILRQIYQQSAAHTPQDALDGLHVQLKTILCMAIHPLCVLHECTCLTDGRLSVQEPWLQQEGREVLSIMSSYMSKIHSLEIKPILEELRLTLDLRNNTFPDLSRELSCISRKMAEYIEDWCPNSAYTTGDTQTNVILDDVFVGNCLELHPISSQNLQRMRMKRSIGSTDKTPQTDDGFLKDMPYHIQCTQCSWKSEVTSARKIEPLSNLAHYIQERLSLQRKMVKSRLDQLAQSNTSHRSARSRKTPPTSKSELLPNSSTESQEQKTLYRTPKRLNLRTIDENSLVRSETIDQITQQTWNVQAVESEGLVVHTSSSIRNSPSPAMTPESVRSSIPAHSGSMSHSSSRKFVVPPIPSQPDYTTLPEVVGAAQVSSYKRSSEPSIRSDASPRSQERKSVWGLFKSPRGPSSSSSTPTAKFFSSGQRLLLWNELGAVYYNTEDTSYTSFHVVTTGDVLLAAGGTHRCIVVTKSGPVLMLMIFQGNDQRPAFEMELEQLPFRIAVSRNDHFAALKFGNLVRILNMATGTIVQHLLPAPSGRSGPNDHLVDFSTDSTFFVACTRFEPEKVVTYSSACEDISMGVSVESAAPYGLVSDDGLSSVVQFGNSAFITTFTEKGYPTHLHLSATRPSSRTLRDKNQQIGSRIHGAVVCSAGDNLVLMNDHNEVFWIMTPFGKEQAPTRVGTIKRTRSVRREVELSMPNSDQVHIFWVEKGKGTLVTLGRHGGKSKPVELNIAIDHLLEV